MQTDLMQTATPEQTAATLLEQQNRSAQRIIEHREIGRKLACRLLREWRVQLNSDDLDSIVDLTVCEAAGRFDESRGVRFTTFLYHYMRGNLLRTIEDIVAQKRAVQAAAYSASAGRNERFDLEDCPELSDSLDPDAMKPQGFDTPEEYMLRRERISMVGRVCAKLRAEEQFVIAKMFFEGSSHQQVGAELGLSKRDVLALQKRALESLRKLVAQEGYETGRSKRETEIAVLSSITLRFRPLRSGGRGRRRSIAAAAEPARRAAV